MQDKRKSRRVRIVSEEPVTVRVGRGMVEYKPEWEGPVVPQVFDNLIQRGAAVEVYRDGEPPAPDVFGADEELFEEDDFEAPADEVRGFGGLETE